MHEVSKAFKDAMNKPLRNRGYIQIGLGAINLEAQTTAELDSANRFIDKKDMFAFWSNESNIFTNKASNEEYATFEQNFLKADGKMLIMPRTSSFINVGVAVKGLSDKDLMVNFDKPYAIKGFTIDFGEYYPDQVFLMGSNGFVSVDLTSSILTTDFNFGTTSYILISADTPSFANKRLRIKSIMCGLALSYSNEDVSDSNFTEFISPISAEVPSSSFDVNIIDEDNIYNVDSKDSVINFLEPGQNVSVSMGIETANSNIEWVKICDLSLQSWESSKGKFSFSAVDKFANNNDKYTLGNRIYNRSAYTEITNILTDMGLTPSQYEVDNYLAAVTLTNPLPEATHKECLQMIANACRCVFYQDSNGKIIVKTNFALVLEPDDIKVNVTSKTAPWSKPENILVGSSDVYADFTRDFIKADGLTKIIPRSENYLDTGFVSDEIADNQGYFNRQPVITLEFKGIASYYGLNISFDGNVPEQMIIKTYRDDSLVSSQEYNELEENTFIDYEFTNFNKIQFIFTKASPRNRVLVNRISFAYFNDYKLRLDDMKEEPYGQRELPVKSISAKVFSYENDDKGKPKEVEDDVWYTVNLNSVGQNLEVENQLIHTTDMAREVCEWLANYYKNNVNYSIEYRGDPRLNANDIIRMESRELNNMQIAIVENNLSFNGAWSGSLSVRKALRKGEEE